MLGSKSSSSSTSCRSLWSLIILGLHHGLGEIAYCPASPKPALIQVKERGGLREANSIVRIRRIGPPWGIPIRGGRRWP
jgi:hypothetical protein